MHVIGEQLFCYMKNRRYIITTDGGLGNQILQYALWLHLKERGYLVTLFFKKNHIKNSFPGSETPKSSLLDKILIYIKPIIVIIYDIINWAKTGKRGTHYITLFNRTIIEFLQWNDYNFVPKMKDVLLKSIPFPQDNNERNNEIKKKILACNSVSVHIRRGDYQDSPRWRMVLGDICDKKYYEDALRKVKEIIPIPVFFIFSDDIEWAKNNLTIDTPTYIDWNKGKNACKDIELMTCCKVNIIANSTFSLCGYFLNVNKKPVVIAPLKWRNVFGDKLRDKYLRKEDAIFIDNMKPQISILVNRKLTASEISLFQKQTFTDYEVISSTKIENDERFHNGSPKGRLLYHYTDSTGYLFKNRHHLTHWLMRSYQNND